MLPPGLFAVAWTASVAAIQTQSPATQPAASSADRVTAFINVAVVPMDTDRVFPNYTVLVEGGRITALGPVGRVQVPARAVRINGTGKFLMPGLADMHFHINYGYADSAKTERRLFLLLSSGVTLVRNVDPGDAGYDVEMGQRHREVVLGLKARAAAGTLLSPRIYTSGYVGYRNTALPGSVDEKVAAYQAAGFDFIKTQGDAQDDVLGDSLLAAAHRLGIPVVGHVPSTKGWFLRHPTAYRSVEHLTAYSEIWKDPAKLPTYVAATRQAGVWICPTLYYAVDQGTVDQPSPMLVTVRRLVKALQDAGVGLLLGTDILWDIGTTVVGGDVSYADEPVSRELAALVRSGLSAYQALLTGTRNAAEFFGTLDSTGTVAVGKRADLVLVRGNPLGDVRHTREPAGVMVAGRWLDRAALDQRLLASEKSWFGAAVGQRGIRYFLTDEQKRTLKTHLTRFENLAHSLAVAVSLPSERKRVLRRQAEELGAMRAVLTTPEQRETFDVAARVWLREQARQGYRVMVPGITLRP
jgi:imidazolonepropionase-like amidohydrolase